MVFKKSVILRNEIKDDDNEKMSEFPDVSTRLHILVIPAVCYTKSCVP